MLKEKQYFSLRKLRVFKIVAGLSRRKNESAFCKLKPGDVIEVKGPIEKLRYSPNMKKHIGMLCGLPGMMKHTSCYEAKDRSQGELTGLLKELGYTEEMVYKF